MRRIFLLAFAAAAGAFPQTVKEESPLRAGCSEASGEVARLPPGQAVKLRFALDADGRKCFAVRAHFDGRQVEGYVWADALAGLDDFEQARRNASSAALPVNTRSQVASVRRAARLEAPRAGKPDYGLSSEVFRAAAALESGRAADAEQILAKASAPDGHRDAAVVRAAALLEMNQPGRALEILEPALRENRGEPQLLALAGMASYQLDDPRRAVEYWKESLELRPDPDLERMIRKTQQEAGADKSTQKSYGTRFLLRYEGAVVDEELAPAMVAALEQEFSRISFQLGCRAEEKIITIVQSRDAYVKTTGAAAWHGGQYDGKIRVPVAGGRHIDSETRQTFAHEIVHACLANLGRWPSWLHEGMAQKLSGATLDARQREQLRTLAREGKLPKLEALGGNWSGFGAARAYLSYAMALTAVDLFFEKYSQYGARNLLNNPETLANITANLNKLLAEAMR